MNEDLLFRVLKRILIRQRRFSGQWHLDEDDGPLIEEIDRELESYEEAKHG